MYDFSSAKSALATLVDMIPDLTQLEFSGPQRFRHHLGRRKLTPSGPPAEYTSQLAKDRAIRRAERWQRANPDKDWKLMPTHIKHNLATATN